MWDFFHFFKLCIQNQKKHLASTHWTSPKNKTLRGSWQDVSGGGGLYSKKAYQRKKRGVCLSSCCDLWQSHSSLWWQRAHILLCLHDWAFYNLTLPALTENTFHWNKINHLMKRTKKRSFSFIDTFQFSDFFAIFFVFLLVVLTYFP